MNNGFRIGKGYFASADLRTSTGIEELIPGQKAAYKFEFMNYGDCHVTVNAETIMFLPKGQGFKMKETDAPITSFKITEAGIQYVHYGAY
jgi:hypothetical protein